MRPRAGFRAHDHEAGFTLVELLIVVAIIGIVAPAITAAILVGLRTTGATANRVSNSHDEQLVSVYLPADIQSVTALSGVDASGTNTGCSGVPNVLHLAWTEQTNLNNPAVSYEAAYAVGQSGGEWQLTRYYCVNSGLITRIVVARNLSGASCCSVANPAQTDPRITMTLTGASVASDTSTFTYTISGTRRVGGTA